ncbi:MAG: hypothetical protein AB1847_19265 [bacterium]
MGDWQYTARNWQMNTRTLWPGRMKRKILIPVLLCLLGGIFLCSTVLSPTTEALASVAAPVNPIDEQGKVWEKKAVSTASGMIHIQWRQCAEPAGNSDSDALSASGALSDSGAISSSGALSAPGIVSASRAIAVSGAISDSGESSVPWECSHQPDSYRIYRGAGEQNPFTTEDKVLTSAPWQADVPGQYCFFRYMPEDEDEGKKFWFLVRAVKDGVESGNLDAESVIVDLPWINGRNDPNSVNFYVVDDQRKDSFLQESLKCPFCSESNKTHFRLARARLVLKRQFAWYYVDLSSGPPPDLEALANCFENEICPTNFAYFGRTGSEWADVDGNGHITILLSRIGDSIDGYFNAEDKIPGYWYKNHVGNCSDMLYISSSISSLESAKGTIAHELQHMQHFEANAEKDSAWEEIWLDEACSEFADEVNNLYFRGMLCYCSIPNEISLTRFGYYDVHDRFGGCPIHWYTSSENYEAFSRVVAHYEQVSLFAHYMEYNTFPVTPLISLVQDPNVGLISVQDHIGMDFRQAFIDWTIANYVNPYADANDVRYHYTAHFPSGAQLLETQSVIPAVMVFPPNGWVKSPQQKPAWMKRSVRDLAADYVLLPQNGSREDHIHWEIKGINTGDNVCHLALLDHTDPLRPFLREVKGIPCFGSGGDQSLSGSNPAASSGDLALSEGGTAVISGNLALSEDDPALSEGAVDLASCLIVTNLARYQDSNYASTYECRAYLSRNPKVLQVRLIQDQHSWTCKEGADSGIGTGNENSESEDGNACVNDGSAAPVKAGWLQVVVQFDQSMSGSDQPSDETVWRGKIDRNQLSVCLHLQDAAAQREAIPVQPAASPWSETLYPSDTWTGTVLIPAGRSDQWDGLARVSISGGENFLQEVMDKDERFSFMIVTHTPQTVKISSQDTCFIAGNAKICWESVPEPDLAGYRIYAASCCENGPVWMPPAWTSAAIPAGWIPIAWIPVESLSDPNYPFYVWPDPEPGIHTLVITAIDHDNNESLPSEPLNLVIRLEIPLDAGMNLVSYAVQAPSADYTSDLWLAGMGTSTRSLGRYLPEAQAYDTAYRNCGIIQGSIFPLVQDDGYIVYRQEAGHLSWSGPVQNQPISLHEGRNIVGISLLSMSVRSLNFFSELVKSGKPVSSTRFYQSSEGRWESSYGFFGQISGHDTKMKKGLGCMIELRE